MSVENHRQSVGQLLDSLGIQVELDEGELVAGALVILETIEEDGDVTMQILEDDGVNWIKRLGMLKAALEVSMADIGSGHHRHDHDHDVED